MNDDFDLAVLHSLRVTDLPPSTVDLARAARAGRRRLRIRYTATAGAVAVLVLLGTVAVAFVTPRPDGSPAGPPVPPASPQPLPTETVAPSLGCVMGPESKPWMSHQPWMVADDSWRVAVYLDDADAIRWIDGRSERIRNVPSGFMAADASRSGAFAGVDNRNTKAWVYRDGRFSRLAMPPDGLSISVRDMNDRGDVVGTVGFLTQVEYGAVVWPAGHPDRPRVLTAPELMDSRAAGIAEDGTVVGDVVGEAGISPYRWHPDGTGEELPLPVEWTSPAQAPWGSGEGGAVGGLVGDWAVGPGVRWNIRTGHADRVQGLQGQGVPDMYGRIYGMGTGPGAPPVVWVNGVIRPLPEPSGEHAFVVFVRRDGRYLSGSRSGGPGSIEWTCGPG